MEVKPRRLHDDDKPDGYKESDQDYLLNNRELAVQLLDDYEKNLAELKFLDCLYAAGVDNWDGYDYAQEMLEEDG